MYFLLGLAAKLPLVGLAWSLLSKGQETGCRVYLGTENEPAQCWELNAQTLFHFSAK